MERLRFHTNLVTMHSVCPIYPMFPISPHSPPLCSPFPHLPNHLTSEKWDFWNFVIDVPHFPTN